MKKTAVEWLLEQYFENSIITPEDFKQAKEMEKQQVRDAWNDGRYENTGCGDSEAYYEEKFNK